MLFRLFYVIFRNACFSKRNVTVKRDNSLRKMSSWKVKQDKKGTKKTQLVFEPQPKSAPTKKDTPSELKKKDERKKREGRESLRS